MTIEQMDPPPKKSSQGQWMRDLIETADANPGVWYRTKNPNTGNASPSFKRLKTTGNYDCCQRRDPNDRQLYFYLKRLTPLENERAYQARCAAELRPLREVATCDNCGKVDHSPTEERACVASALIPELTGINDTTSAWQ